LPDIFVSLKYAILPLHMEKQINIGDQNTQQIAQNPIIEPVVVPKKPMVKYWIIIAFLIVSVLSVGGFFVVNLYNKNKNSLNQQRITSDFTNPNTGDLYQDIKVRMKELLP